MKKTIITTILIALFSLTTISAEKIRVASKSFTEGYILGSMVVELLENAGYQVDYKDGMSSFIIRSALVNDQIDLYVEYTGTAWMAYLKQQDIIDDPVLLLEKVREKDLLENGIVWYDAIDFNNTYGLAIKEEFARENNLETLSDLADYINQNNKLIFGVNFDFFERPDGFFAIAEHYGMVISKKNVKTMEIGVTYEALSRGNIDVAMVFSTDGKLDKYNLKVLQDNKTFFPIYNPAVCVREEIHNKYPDIQEILRPLNKYLNPQIIRRLNFLVDIGEAEPENIARDYLKTLGLIH
jgi:osmoprotectant transport system substrate-binding protein